MHIFGNRQFVEIPGDDMVALPPLLINKPKPLNLGRIMNLAINVAEVDNLIPIFPLDGIIQTKSREIEMAVNLVDAYLVLHEQWHWGNGILEWIRQCETTFSYRPNLQRLLRPDVWPHAGRSSFVTLLKDKAAHADAAFIENSVGLRLAFRQPLPLACATDQFLFYLGPTLANTAYQNWAGMNPASVHDLPPERFSVQVVVV